uniref:SFR19-like C-terminal domain-containing protein n=1 Tax=Chelonoidis abingdonii TaxID=106734 RepID=A0A8C0J193_CHEAB
EEEEAESQDGAEEVEGRQLQPGGREPTRPCPRADGGRRLPTHGEVCPGLRAGGRPRSCGMGGTPSPKLHTQERAVEEVKLAIKPYYQKKEITKEEYKDILRKAVHKICHSKSGEINPVKVNNLVRAYVQRYKYFRKHGRRMEEEPGGPKDLGGLEKASLPMPPL